MIVAKDIIKIYSGPNNHPEKSTVALNSVSLKIEKGEIVAIVGESGAGKTTFLKVLLGILKPDSGIIIIRNQSIYSLKNKERNDFRSKYFYFIPQNLEENLISELNGRENIELELLSRDESIDKFEKILDEIKNEIPIFLDFSIPVSKLSGGEKQLLCFIKGMVNLPEIIVIDEPTSFLDSKLKHEIMNALVKLAIKYDITLIITTHDPEIASYAEKVVGISEGRFDRVLNKNKDEINIPPSTIENLMLGKFTEIPINPSGTIHLPKTLLVNLKFEDSALMTVENNKIILYPKK